MESNKKKQSLFDKYGGQGIVDILVDKFYEKMISNEKVKHFFDGVDIKKLKNHQKRFISIALGAPNKYEGKSIRKAHAHLNIKESPHFDTLIDCLSDTMDELGMHEDDIVAVIGIVVKLRDDVLNR